MFTLTSAFLLPALAQEIECAPPSDFTFVPADGNVVAQQIDALVKVRNAQACPVDIQIVDMVAAVRAQTSHDAREDRVAVLPMVELEAGGYALQVLDSASLDLLESVAFTVGDELRTPAPEPPTGTLEADQDFPGQPTNIRFRLDEVVPGTVLSVVGADIDAIEPADEVFYGETTGFDAGDELCVDVALRSAASDFSEAVQVCTIIEDSPGPEHEGSPIPSVSCGCSSQTGSSVESFLGLSMWAMLASRRRS
jgi:hypothetical protein